MADSLLAALLPKARPVPDERFGAAYEAVSAADRGLLKTGIKHLFEACHAHRRAPSLDAASCGGFALTRIARPRDFALVAVPAAGAAPMPLLAAALPALLAGVPEVAVVCLGGKLDAPCLAALELAGIETALEASAADLAGLPAALAAADGAHLAGTVVVIDPAAVPPKALAGLAACPALTLAVQPRPRLAVLAGPRARWDCQAVALAQGNAPVDIFGEPAGLGLAGLPDAFSRRPGGLDELVASRPDVAWVPENAVRRALGKVPLLLGPGRESCFLWPGLSPALFAVQALALSGRLPV